MTPTRLSPRGRHLLTIEEGFKLEMYKDVAGYPTIGVGHLLTKQELASGVLMITMPHTSGPVAVPWKKGLTRYQVDALLAQDVAVYDAGVRNGVVVPLNQPQFDALVSFSFNVGLTAFRNSTLLRRLNEGKYADVPPQLTRWNKAGGKVIAGLTARRKREGQLWISPPYGENI